MAINNPLPSHSRDEEVGNFLKRLNGAPVAPAVGCITSAGAATSNATTATPFLLTQASLYFLQCDTACYVASGATSAAAIAAVTGSSATAGAAKIDPTTYGTGFMWQMPLSDSFLAILPVAGTTNLKALGML